MSKQQIPSRDTKGHGWVETEINSSMYDEAKGLDISDVKVCINTDHLGSSDTVTNVQVFEIL